VLFVVARIFLSQRACGFSKQDGAFPLIDPARGELLPPPLPEEMEVEKIAHRARFSRIIFWGSLSTVIN
jgi:hypothetical protein